MAQLNCPLALQADQRPEAIALLQQRPDDAPAMQWNFLQLDRAVRCKQAWLRAHGAKAGHHLAVVSTDKTELVLLLFAALRLGLVLIPLNPAFPPARLQTLIERCAADLLIGQTTGLSLPSGCQPLPSEVTNDTTADSDEQSAQIPDPQQPLTGTFTSGSTGVPKLALHSYLNHAASAEGSRQLITLQPGAGWGLSLPLYHIGGLAVIFRCILAGACLVAPCRNEPLQRLLSEPRLTHLSAVTTQLLQLRQQGINLSDYPLTTLLLGGSAIPATLLQWLQAQQLRCLISYGLTEMASQVVTGPINAAAALLQRLPHCQLKLDNSGEILVRGDSLLLGYYDRGTIQRPLDKQGWFHTRDLGEYHPTAGLRVIGRLDNQFISGGENIQPETIEQQILTFPGISDAVVVPLADPHYGQRPVAFIAPEAALCAEAPLDAQLVSELSGWLRQRLAGYQLPQHYLPLPANPRQLKPQRHELALLAAERSH